MGCLQCLLASLAAGAGAEMQYCSPVLCRKLIAEQFTEPADSNWVRYPALKD